MTPIWVPLAVAALGAVVAVAGWFVSASRTRKNTLESNRHNNNLKERNEIYAFLLAQGARYLNDEEIDPTTLDRERVAKLDIHASKAAKKAWSEFRAAMQPAGAGGELGRLIREGFRNPPTTEAEAAAATQRQYAASDQLRKMAEGRYRQLADAIRAELLPTTELEP